MRRASLVALALLLAAGIGSCGARYSYGSSGGSFTSSVYLPTQRGVSLGQFSGDYGRSGSNAHSYSSTLTLNPGIRPEDYEFVAYIFQDLNGDGEYSSQADRLLAVSEAPRVSSNELSLEPIEFIFKPHHEPVGIHWSISGPEGEAFVRSELLD